MCVCLGLQGRQSQERRKKTLLSCYFIPYVVHLCSGHDSVVFRETLFNTPCSVLMQEVSPEQLLFGSSALGRVQKAVYFTRYSALGRGEI